MKRAEGSMSSPQVCSWKSRAQRRVDKKKASKLSVLPYLLCQLHHKSPIFLLIPVSLSPWSWMMSMLLYKRSLWQLHGKRRWLKRKASCRSSLSRRIRTFSTRVSEYSISLPHFSNWETDPKNSMIQSRSLWLTGIRRSCLLFICKTCSNLRTHSVVMQSQTRSMLRSSPMLMPPVSWPKLWAVSWKLRLRLSPSH